MLELPACRPLRSAAPTLCKMDALCWKGFIARSGTWQGSWRHSAFSRVLRVSTVGYGSLNRAPSMHGQPRAKKGTEDPEKIRKRNRKVFAFVMLRPS